MKWASWTNVVLGVWLIIAPFTLGYASARTAVTEDMILGLVIASFALARALAPETSSMAGVSWVVAAAGLWVLFAPLALGYTAVTMATSNDVIVGLAVLTLGTWRAVHRSPEMPHDTLMHHH